MTELPEKFPLTSADIAAEKREQLRRCLAAAFPEIMAEDKIDLDQLRRVLGEWVEPDRERFGLTWPGKAACMKVIQAPSVGTLKPCREESVDWDTTENVFIEGDNLEVLKLLQKAYFGKIKMIYIDPPYNTGKEFIYPDKYAETLDTYLEYTGQKDAEGRRFSTNTDAAGRYHSRWLSMMYPRLYLAKNLLADNGVIFITIDDSEHANLKLLCDQIFGEENFRADISWQKKYSVSNNFKGIASIRDSILCYAKSQSFENGLLPRSDESRARYINPDNDPRGPWKPVDYWNIAAVEDRPNLVYPILNPHTGKEIVPEHKAWKFAREVHLTHVAENRIWWGKDGTNSVPALKLFLSDVRDGLIPHNWWPHEEAGHTDGAKKQLDELFDGVAPFDTPKPLMLIKRMMQITGISDGDLVLDFFAGSASTAHAVFEYNVESGSRIRIIMIQLPEPTDNQKYKNIAQISRDRLRRASSKISERKSEQLKLDICTDQDIGFKAFRLDYSNFRSWNGTVTDEAQLEGQLSLHIDHIASTSSAEDILYELLLKDGFPLATPIEKRALAGKEVFSIASGALLICLDRQLTQDVIDAMADLEPQRVICLDAGFQGNDQLKANAVQTFKARARNRETAIEFRTV